MRNPDYQRWFGSPAADYSSDTRGRDAIMGIATHSRSSQFEKERKKPHATCRVEGRLDQRWGLEGLSSLKGNVRSCCDFGGGLNNHQNPQVFTWGISLGDIITGGRLGCTWRLETGDSELFNFGVRLP